jgi:DNA primase
VVAPQTALKNEGSKETAKDPAEILLYCGLEALQKEAKCFINDFDYLIARARSLYGNSGQGKAQAVAFLFPYMELLDSEVARDSCIEAAADAFGLLPSVVADDYRRYASDRRLRKNRSAEHGGGIKEEAHSRQSGGRTGSPIRMNDELFLLIVVAVNYASSRKEKLFPGFRTALEINEIEDPNAKEIFIALEECIRYGETSIDELLARISSEELKKFVVERSVSEEFSMNAPQLVADGITKVKVKRLERQEEEIIIKLRLLKKDVPSGDRGSETKELLAEKMRIDNELLLLKQGR